MKQKKNENQYMYTLMSTVANGCEKNVGDYVMAENMQAAYDIAVSVCSDLNKKYGIGYSVQSVMPA